MMARFNARSAHCTMIQWPVPIDVGSCLEVCSLRQDAVPPTSLVILVWLRDCTQTRLLGATKSLSDRGLIDCEESSARCG